MILVSEGLMNSIETKTIYSTIDGIACEINIPTYRHTILANVHLC